MRDTGRTGADAGDTQIAAEPGLTPAGPPDRPRRTITPSGRTVVLLACGIIMLVSRFHTRHEPIQVDVAAYATIAHELLAGRALYSDLWDHKPPAVHVTYAVFERLCGYGETELLVMTLCFSLVSLLLLERLTRDIAGDRAALAAAVLWAFASGDLFVQGTEPNCELMLNTCALAAMVCFVRTDERSLKWPLLCGVFLAAGSLYKMTAVLLALVLVPLLLVRRDRWALNRHGLLQVLVMALPGMLAWVGMSLYFALTGRLGDYYEAVFAYNQRYAHGLLANLLGFLRPENCLFSRAYTGIQPLLCFTVVWVVLYLRGSHDFRRSALVIFGLGSVLRVAAPGRYFEHYYRLLLPFFCIATGIVWVKILDGELIPVRRGPSRVLRAVALAIPFACVLLFYVWYQVLSTSQISRLKYGDRFVHSKALCRKLAGLMRPSDKVYPHGGTPSVYFYLKQRPISGFVYAFSLYGRDPATLARRAKLEDAILRERPEFVVFDRALFEGWAKEFFTQHYETVEDYHDYVILRRKR